MSSDQTDTAAMSFSIGIVCGRTQLGVPLGKWSLMRSITITRGSVGRRMLVVNFAFAA
ncbi:protein of unknown function (plasmid) [Cupriavidus taiwanensis]|nr:protein of unknown function [Cupriavidus taiwanensis]SPD54574.1 protein of unknown function [Cupriavidus taiwanensis]